MPDTNRPTYQSLLDEAGAETGSLFTSEQYSASVTDDKDRFIQWVNNQTRLNAFNMNTINRLIQSYGGWIGNESINYLTGGVIKHVIENSAGWAYKLTDPAAGGEIFSDYMNNVATGNHSTAFGENSKAEQDNQFVIGKFNKSNSEAIFIVGWGEEGAENNIFCILKDGRVQVPSSSSPKDDGDLVNKGHLDSELERIKQLNQWLGTLHVSSDIFNNKDALQKALNDEVKNLSPSGRDYARNGDLITIIIDDKKPTDPQYPEIWIFLETNPNDPKSHEGTWQFYSSQQELLNASKAVKGLVQIGDNINVTDGLISVPVATDAILGLVKNGKTIINKDGTLDVNVGDKFEVTDDGKIEIKLATKDNAGVVMIGDNIKVNSGIISVPIATDSELGLVKVGKGLSASSDGTLSVVWDDL